MIFKYIHMNIQEDFYHEMYAHQIAGLLC